MIGFMPEIYPDELLYSRFARYYERSGYMAYIFAAEDLFQNKNERPDVEFINRLTQDAQSVIHKKMSADEVIMNHTMFPYYGRFLGKERRTEAYFALLNTDGNYRNLLPIPKAKRQRFLRYCPMCVNMDRDKYGETYWHRAHQMQSVDICPVHFCVLQNTDIAIGSTTSPRFYAAENMIKDFEKIEVVEDEKERKLVQYILDVFASNIDFDNDTKLGDYLSYRLKGTKYMTGALRNMQGLTNDFNDFYGTETELWRIQKILTNVNVKIRDICMLAMFLKITPEELNNPHIGESVIKLNRKKVYTNAKPGTKARDWNSVDNAALPKVQKAIETLKCTEPPKRVTGYAIERILKLPSKQIQKLPKCRTEVLKHSETQIQFWARKIEWAVKKLVAENQPINLKHIRTLTNMRKENILSVMPYLDDETKEKVNLVL
mgnify:FL=1